MDYNSLGQGQLGYQQDIFAAPFNPINANPGGWSVDPFYLTPAYTAPYRPGYQGGNGYNAYDYASPTFRQAADRTFNPVGPGIPKFSNSYATLGTSYDSMYYNPVDAAASFTQKYLAPGAASLAISYAASKMIVQRSNALTGGIVGGFKRALGGSAAEAAQAAKYTGIFTKVGDSFGRGIVNTGFGMLNRQAPAMLSNAVGGAMGVASNLALPLLATQAATKVLDTTFFDPYIATAQTARAMKQNYAHVNLDPSLSEHNTGRGLSYEASASIGRRTTSLATHDRTLELGDYSMIADIGTRSGLMSNVNNSTQMVSRVKELAEQVKLVMNVANEPSVKEAMSMITRMRSAGVSDSKMGTTIQNLTQYAGMSGVSVQRLMNTVGMQGQMMAQQAGMAPYVGQLMAGRTFASFRAAERMGIMSPEVLAMMGGTEGATQSAMGGNFKAMQSLQGRMFLFNKYMMGGGAGTSRDPVNAAAMFSQGFLKDPINALGLSSMNQGMMASKELKDNPNALIEQAEASYISKMPRGMFYGTDGAIKAGSLFQVLTKQLGMSEEEANAYIRQRVALGSEKIQNNMRQGLRATMEEQRVGALDQLGLSGGVIGNTVTSGLTDLKKGLQRFGAPLVGVPLEQSSGTWDNFRTWWENSMYGESSAKTANSRKRLSDGRDIVSFGNDKHDVGGLQGKLGIFGVGIANTAINGYLDNKNQGGARTLQRMLDEDKTGKLKGYLTAAKAGGRSAKDKLSMVLANQNVSREEIADIIGNISKLELKHEDGSKYSASRADVLYNQMIGEGAVYDRSNAGRPENFKEGFANYTARADKANVDVGIVAADLASYQTWLSDKYKGQNKTVDDATDDEHKLLQNKIDRYRALSGKKDLNANEVINQAYAHVGKAGKSAATMDALARTFGGNTVSELMKDGDKFSKMAKKLGMDEKSIASFQKAAKSGDHEAASKVLTGYVNDRSIKAGLGDLEDRAIGSAGGALSDDASLDLGKMAINQLRTYSKAHLELEKQFKGKKIDATGMVQAESDLMFGKSVATFALAVEKFDKLSNKGAASNSPVVPANPANPAAQQVPTVGQNILNKIGFGNKGNLRSYE